MLDGAAGPLQERDGRTIHGREERGFRVARTSARGAESACSATRSPSTQKKPRRAVTKSPARWGAVTSAKAGQSYRMRPARATSRGGDGYALIFSFAGIASVR